MLSKHNEIQHNEFLHGEFLSVEDRFPVATGL